ncbi:MAG TPA: outer membrane beta-barrel protein [Caulobacteraceae bacterium]|jgi:opacity protein-like surface antigen
MKSLIIAAVAVVGASMAAPALAQTTTTAPTLTQPQGYLNLGYTYLNPYGHDLGELFGRGGVKFSRYWGVEGEVGGGVLGNHFATGRSINSRVNLSEGVQSAIYGVGYLPLPMWGGDKLELLARAGYGETPLRIRSDVGPTANNSNNQITVANWNYGAGVQYALNGKDGLRFDYTRRDFQDKGPDNPKDMDTYSVAFVHKF